MQLHTHYSMSVYLPVRVCTQNTLNIRKKYLIYIYIQHHTFRDCMQLSLDSQTSYKNASTEVTCYYAMKVLLSYVLLLSNSQI